MDRGYSSKMDGGGRRTIRKIKMWTEMDGSTNGRKFVRGGLIQSLGLASNPSYRNFLVVLGGLATGPVSPTLTFAILFGTIKLLASNGEEFLSDFTM